ncbi:MAG: haloacid dehalogenase type II [Parasphingorhabdus sp.]
MKKSEAAPIIVFDVNETLLDITTIEPLFDRLFGDAAMLRAWFAELILYSQTMTLSGLYAPFGELAAGTLQMVGSNHDIAVSDADIVELKERLGDMPAYPDVVPALTRLRDAGFRLVTLTNSAGGPSPTPLEKAGIDPFFDRHFSVEAVQKFKPAPDTYQYVARELGVEIAGLQMVACHLWDIVGAQAAGCQGAFVTRPNNAILPAEGLPAPDITVSGLGELADHLVAQS